MTSPGIDRTSPVPFYHQLKVLFLDDIASRGLAAGDRLPSDFQLCDRYGVSRTVVRQMLSDLEHDGVVVREKGRGTFVAQVKSAQGLVQSLTGLHEDAARNGLSLRSVVRRLERVPAPEPVAAALDVEPGSPVVLLDRLRFLSEVPWVQVNTYLPVGLVPDLEREDLETGSLYAILDRHGARPVSGRRSVEARVATTALARELQIGRGGAVLFLSSLGIDASGRRVEWFEAFHRGDRTRFDVSLAAPGSATPGPGVAVVPSVH